jgi:hypothetical protein
MKNEFKKNLQKGTIYLKDGVWVVRYEFLKNAIRYITIREQDAKNLRHPYDQAKETCFEIITQGENLDQYAKIWSTSEWVQNFQYYLENTPQEELDKAWEETKEFSNTGPTVGEFLGMNNSMEKAFLLSHIDRKETCYKLVYAETEQEAKIKLKDELDKMYLNLFGWKNIEHYIDSETIL